MNGRGTTSGRARRSGGAGRSDGAGAAGTVRPAAAALLALGSAAAVAQPAAATPSPRPVSFRGIPVEVPAGWPVVDLTRDPTACVRYDRHAAYLGTAGARQNCSASAVGRQTTLQLEALARPPARAAITESTGTVVATLPAPALRVTVKYGADRAAAVALLARLGNRWGLRLAAPAPTAAPAAAPAGRTAALPAARVRTYKGRGFDACTAPSNGSMDAWRRAYRSIGVYIGGINRACSQPNLTSSWVRYQHSRGWHLMPLYVGRQAPCWGHSGALVPATGAVAAGRTDAGDAVRQARGIGLGRGTPIYLDLEGYSGSSACSAAVVKYVSGWSQGLRAVGYVSGFYSSAASGIRDVADTYHSTRYTRPDAIWMGRWDWRPKLFNEPSVPNSYWAHHRRAKQYRGGHDETHGGVTINIDWDILDAPVG